MKLSLILEAIDRASRPLDRVGDAAGGLGRSARGAARDVGALDRQSGEATRSTARLGREAEDAADEVRDLGRQSDRAGRSADRLGRNAHEAAGDVRDLGREADRATDDVRDLDRSLDRAARSSGRMERAARGIGSGLAAASRRGIGALGAIDRRLTISQGRMEKMAFAAGSLIGSTIRGGVMAGGAIAGAGLSAALYKVVTAGLMFEKFNAQLRGIEGSAEGGKRAMEWIKSFAAKTPYELDQVVEAFAKLKGQGIDPTDGSLKMLGDTAGGTGKTLEQAVEMYTDAVGLDYERLKEFGLRASVAGDKVTLRWQRNGKAMSKTVRNFATDVSVALKEIFGSKFAGGMALLAQTTAGKWSNLMDTLTITSNRVWEGGFGDAINQQIDRLNTWVASMEKDGSLKKWATETGQGLGDLVATIGSADWKKIASDFRDLGGSISRLASSLRELDATGNAIARFLDQAPGRAAQPLLDFHEWMKKPLWGEASPPANRRPGPAQPVMRRQVASPMRNEGRRNSASPWQPRRAPGPARPLPTQKAAPAKAAPAPKGKLEISVKTTPGASAKVTKVAATGMDVQVNTGRAMGAFA